jgi:hypothetical protein
MAKAGGGRNIKYTTTARAVAKRETAQGKRVMVGSNGSRPPYICVHGPYGGCLRYEYNAELDIYGPASTQVDCSTCKYF